MDVGHTNVFQDPMSVELDEETVKNFFGWSFVKRALLEKRSPGVILQDKYGYLKESHLRAVRTWLDQCPWGMKVIYSEQNNDSERWRTEKWVALYNGTIPVGCLGLRVTEGGYIRVHMVTPGSQWAEKFPKLDPPPPAKESYGNLFTLMRSGNSIAIQEFHKNAGHPLVPQNYDPEVLKKYNTVQEQFALPSPHGRLAIFSGPPGTGKTTLFENLIYDWRDKADMIYVPSHLVPLLGNPDLLPVLKSYRDRTHRYMIFILEDADECLVERSDGNVSSVSALLNLTDGMLGKGLDLRILATTNNEVHLDKACSRPGRLLLRCSVQNLSQDHAVARLRELVPGVTESSVEGFVKREDFSLAAVYLEAKTLGWKESPRKDPDLASQEDHPEGSPSWEELMSIFDDS